MSEEGEAVIIAMIAVVVAILIGICVWMMTDLEPVAVVQIMLYSFGGILIIIGAIGSGMGI